MQFLEIIEILENRLNYHVDHILRNFGGGNKGSSDTESHRILIVAAIHSGRDGRFSVVIIFFDQCVNDLTLDVYQYRVAGGGGFFDRTTWMTDGKNDCIDLVVAQS